ncbi:glycosyltransferase [Winogradskyella sp. SM1960]|uniref:glycosyltransferase n=1 Tax=Winogradskyella sp. SM1960 TaxID=2865955 RepID=UPI001CD5F7CA|nr:glycosyltransferase [Winogradskyella sp. SM1960]
MNSKKILIVTRFFHPDITPRAFRAFELAKELSRQGHNVTVLTTKRDFDYTEIENKHKLTIKATVKNEPKELLGGGIKRAIRFSLKHFFLFPFIFLSRHFKNSLKKESDYDLLISIAHPYPVHFGVVLALNKNKLLTKTWIADCGDPFASEQEGRLKNPFYYKIIEKWFCEKTNFITIPIAEAKVAYPSMCQHKLKVIPQGFNFKDITPNYDLSKNKVPTFAYAGNLSPGIRDPRKFLDFLIETGKDFKLILYTRNKGFLLSYAEVLGQKLEFREYVPRDVLLKELGQMDFLLNLENKNTVQSPSKLIDYTLLERPILSIKPFDINKQTIMEFLNGDFTNALVLKNVEDYNIKNVAVQFLALNKKEL